MSRLGLPKEYDYWLAEYSPIIPQKSITTNRKPSFPPSHGSTTEWGQSAPHQRGVFIPAAIYIATVKSC